jgi:hypothetical protein
MFTGDTSGHVVKWEQKHTNQVVFTHETLLKSEFAERESSKIQGAAYSSKEKQNIPAKKKKQSSMIGFKRTNLILKLLYVESLDLIFGACEGKLLAVYEIDKLNFELYA